MSKQVIVEVCIGGQSKTTITDVNDDVEVSDLGSKIADNISERLGQDVEVTVIDVAELNKQNQEGD